MAKVKSKRKFNPWLLTLIAAPIVAVGIYVVYRAVAANADINGDGTVNISDLSVLASNFGGSGKTFAQGDLNADGSVNILDFSILAFNWGTGGSTGPSCTNTINPGTLSSVATAFNGLGTNGVLCLRGGTYSGQAITLSRSGTSSARLTIRSYPGETAVLDGTGINLGKTNDVITISGSFVDFDGITVRNSSGRGLRTTGQNIVVKNGKFHAIQYNGILDAGTNNTIHNNEVFDTVLSNKDNAIGRQNVGSGSAYGSQWAEAINTYISTNTTMTNNYVHHNWGEGIDYIGSNGGLVEGNIVEYNFSVNIYIDGSSNVIVRGNKTAGRIRSNPPGMTLTDKPLTDILVASEGGSGISGNVVTGNFFRTAGIESGYQSAANIATWNVSASSVTISNNFRNCSSTYTSCTSF